MVILESLQLPGALPVLTCTIMSLLFLQYIIWILPADDHDALKFLTYSLASPDSAITEDARISEAEREKLSQEFQEYQDKLQKQKDE